MQQKDKLDGAPMMMQLKLKPCRNDLPDGIFANVEYATE